MSVLRQALTDGAQPAASIFHAAADAARILSGADGIAIAVRTKGVVVCRARSGDMAPDVGTPLNAESGISGECLRSGATLICHDTETDPRVDADVCRILGIRSIAALPLRSPTGISGILEAFSATPFAFDDDQVASLKEFSEIAEAAYEREVRPRPAAPELAARPVPAAKPARKEFFPSISEADKARAEELFGAPSRKRRYWISAIAIVALALITGVVWLSWLDPSVESSTAEIQLRSAEAADSPATPAASAPAPKPQAGTSPAFSHPRTGPLHNAAEIQPEVNHVTNRTIEAPSSVPTVAAGTATAKPASDRSSSIPAEPPPDIQVAESRDSVLLSSLTPQPAMPTLGVPVSQGLTQGTLIHRVEPEYPMQARVQHVAGSVVLDATVGKDGNVHSIKLISGPPLLAAAAREAVRKWRYSPPLLNGSPIEVQKQITIVFKLP